MNRDVVEALIEARTTEARYDDRARQVAGAVQEATGAATCLLFGSRARGDHHPQSDIDLLVVHPDIAGLDPACRAAARQAVRRLYGTHLNTDVVVLSSRLFAIVRHGRNHVAAAAVREGITPTGCHYHPPSGEPPMEPSSRETQRLETMERAWHAVEQRAALQAYRRNFPPGTHGLLFGRAAQQVLEHAIKALIAAHGRRYTRTHNLTELSDQARAVAPDLDLSSPLSHLSEFAGTHVYGSPALLIGTEDLCDRVERDLAHLFALIQDRSDFDPWKIQPSDFQF